MWYRIHFHAKNKQYFSIFIALNNNLPLNIMKKLISLISAAILSVIGSYAQNEYALFIETDKKVLFIDQFNLPESATILEALSILPELLSRTDNAVLSNYDVKIDGFSLGAAYEGTLSQVRLGQVQKIEISESPIDSYKNNGVGGSINIILKPLDEGFSGEVALSAYSLFEIKPMLQIGYKKNGLTLRGIAEFDYYNPKGTVINTQGYADGKEVPYSQTDSTDRRYTSETARILMEYRPTEQDEFKLRFAEHISWDDNNQLIDAKEGDIYSKTNKQFDGKRLNIDANAKFKHTFASNGSIFQLESTYSYTPTENKSTVLSYRSIGAQDLNHSISGKAEYEQHFQTARPENFTKLIIGVNTNNATIEKYYNLCYDFEPDEEICVNSVIHTWFISPYAKIDAKIVNWRLKAEVEYQNFNYNVRGGLDKTKYTANRGDLTGKVMAGWQINANNHIQLVYDRKLERPQGAMLYPYITFNPEYERYEFGNPELYPMTINEVSLNYITNFERGIHKFVFNGEITYMNVNDMLTPVQKMDPQKRKKYTMYENKGVNNIVIGEVTAIYTINKLCNISFTGNVYNNHKNIDGTEDDYTYYNMSLFPSFNFKRNWGVSSRLTYYSRVTTNDSEIGATTTLSLSANKSWRKFTAYIYGILPLNGKSVNITQAEGMYLKKTYWYLYPYAGITFNYKF